MRAAPLYTPVQPIGDVTPPSESLLIMAVSEEGSVWQWDMPLQVDLSSMSQISRNVCPIGSKFPIEKRPSSAIEENVSVLLAI